MKNFFTRVEICSLFILAIIFAACNSVPPPEPFLPVPSERQLAWHEMEFYAFVHFNMNTFSNKEWGFGDENPSLFNPTELNCRQWAKVCKEAGMKGIILTAKHHDGFCLWPSEFTEHSVKNAPWKNGNGDVVRELSDACQEYGLKMGIYLSPWDRNHADYGKPEYITYFRNQLRELLTNYGEIFEVWFDGANGGTGYYGGANEERKIDNKIYYDWSNTWKIVRELQPNAVMFSDGGPDVRWVGNESGWARPTNWSTLNRDDFAPGVVPDIEFLRQGQEDGTHWLPAEVDVSIRPGWYYHESEDHRVKTLPDLLDIYYNSIGRNASFLLNLPVDRRGLVHEKDVEQLHKLRQAVDADFAEDLAKGAKVVASNTRGKGSRYQASNVTDGDSDSYWCTDDDVVTGSLEIFFDDLTELNRFLVQEDIRYGQRVREFKLEASVDGEWIPVVNETTIGRKRILRFPNIKTHGLRFTVVDSKACPVISNIEVYKAPKVLIEPDIRRNKNGIVTIQSFDTGLEIYYTLDGAKPGLNSPKYSGPFELNKKAIVTAMAYDRGEGKESEPSTREFDRVKANWKVVGKTVQPENINNIFDDDQTTSWRSSLDKQSDLIIDLGTVVDLEGFKYLPEQGRRDPGIISDYRFYVSMDGKNWGNPVSVGEFSNIKNSPVLQIKKFKARRGRYIKFSALNSVSEEGNIGMAEFDIITKSNN